MHDRTCDYCDDNFLSPLLLQEHISERHAIAYLQCHSCMLRFQTKLQLRTHVKTCHEPPSGSITGIGASSTTSVAKAGPSTSFSSSIQSSAASESKNLWLSMLSFNVEGFRRNRHYLSHLLCNSKPKIVFLQEIWLPYSDQNTLNSYHPDYSFKISTLTCFNILKTCLQNQNMCGMVWQ